MRSVMLACATLAAACAPLAAQTADSAAFIIRLGRDTTAIERYIRTGNRITAVALQRSPSTTLHQLVVELGSDGRVTRAEHSVRRPGELGDAPAALRRVYTFAGDSVTIATTQGAQQSTQRVAVRDAIPIAGPFYTPYELALMRFVRDGTRTPLLSGTSAVPIELSRTRSDTVALTNQFGEPMRAHIDARGRLLHLNTPAFTTVERTRWIDLERLARDFVARDEAGKGLGVLSPRATYRTRVGAANIWVDYGRPGARGRPIWGALVPWNQIWRMGANDAAHFATDRVVQLGDLTLQPGTYTLFLLPTPDRWTLVVNRQTGMSGLEHDPAQDVGRVPLTVEPLNATVEAFTIAVEPNAPTPRLTISWGDRRAWVPLTVR